MTSMVGVGVGYTIREREPGDIWITREITDYRTNPKTLVCAGVEIDNRNQGGLSFTIDGTFMARIEKLEKDVAEIREALHEIDDILSAPGGPRSQILYEACKKVCKEQELPDTSSG